MGSAIMRVAGIVHACFTRCRVESQEALATTVTHVAVFWVATIMLRRKVDAREAVGDVEGNRANETGAEEDLQDLELGGSPSLSVLSDPLEVEQYLMRRC